MISTAVGLGLDGYFLLVVCISTLQWHLEVLKPTAMLMSCYVSITTLL